MEAALLQTTSSLGGNYRIQVPSCKLQALQDALREAIPILQQSHDRHVAPPPTQTVSLAWLWDLCEGSTSMEPADLVGTILDIATSTTNTDESHQQAALFDAVGEEGLSLLLEITPLLPAIRQSGLTRRDVQAERRKRGATFGTTTAMMTTTDPAATHRATLYQQALEAQHKAVLAQAQLEESTTTSSVPGTHTLQRASDVSAQKRADKAVQKAKVAWQKAKDAGAVLDASELLQLQDPVSSAPKELLPEGSRQYYDDRGLPRDAIREIEGDLERVIIPAAKKDPNNVAERLVIEDVMDEDCAAVFAGTKSLNPMQSATFEAAFKLRDNLMICAPTGAGKTNVALLTVAAHFRDVGLLGAFHERLVETGKKVVYIAPMKALAQEVVEKFSAKLKPLRLIVRELTGDMQLTRAEADSANVIVTTPEKWDVVTRKSGSDENSLGNQCGLLIIDEVHLLADERGAVIESVVARLHRLVESRQRQVRMVALSATLPNYEDVAEFLQVPKRGIFYFGPEHRPVPLEQTFIGINVNVKNRQLKEKRMNEVCFDVVLDSLQRGYQVMVFVHSRKGTGDTATSLAELASLESVLDKNFCTAGKEGPNGDAYKRYRERASKSRNRELSTHFENGMGIHHAGMLRGDRKLTEQMFNDGAIKVLCCTATLAWGINLPAHSVVIKGTEIYNPEKGGTVDLSILDVQQIFGRAGRPQFDSSGEATLITTNEAFPRYMNKLVRPVPIESNFIKQLPDHLNAEIVGGTVSNLREAARWLTYTYLYVRMLRNPLAYGISEDQKHDDPMLSKRCMDLVTQAAKELDANKMIRGNNKAGNLGAVDKGRVAAHFYIQSETIQTFNEELHGQLNEAKLCRVICSAQEFQNMRLRPEEMDELQSLTKVCPFKIAGPGKDDENQALVTDATDKAFVLLQAYISRERVRSFTLISDTNYIASNGGRVARALFEICLRMNMSGAAARLLRIAKSIDNQLWWFKMPLRQFPKEFSESVMQAFERRFTKSKHFGFDNALSLLDMQAGEVGSIAKSKADVGLKVQRFLKMLPKFLVDYKIKPITGSVLRFHISLEADFHWDGRWHGGAQVFWMWLDDGETVHHHEQFVISKKSFREPKAFDFSIPHFDASDKQYLIRIISDRWVGVEQLYPVPMNDIDVPQEKTLYTDLFDLAPLPTTALNNPAYEQLYKKFRTFNPIQTQLFHVLYHTDSPVLLGAPTGSGKTAVAELAILRMKSLYPKSICVYIAPLKALARERLKEWTTRLGVAPLNWTVLELSGDTHHDKSVLERADILVCTPEKWDLISRGWKGMSGVSTRGFVKRVRLLVMDEVHLLGEDRGAVLEAIVSRTRFISRQLHAEQKSDETENVVKREATRIIGLSTMLANSLDLAAWIGIDTEGYGPTARRGLYNFRHSVRPVPTKVHLQGYTGKHYCPRMATMNRPCFAAIKELSPTKPTLIFVASRRQTRLTAFDIITYAAGDETPKMFLGCSEDYAEAMAENIKDDSLRHTLCFGIGLHHAGLSSGDREIVEKMFLSGEIKVLVATATLAWGVNLPAHLVIVKGTEFFDGSTHNYVDYPLTDVLQMIGRAGRPGFDTEAVAVVMVMDEKKSFYKKFLYSAFPVESCLDQRLNENLNAEIAGGTILTSEDARGYLGWTFFSRRVKKNPTYYGAKSNNTGDVEEFLRAVVDRTLLELQTLGCITMSQESSEVSTTTLGNAASQFYLVCSTPLQLLFGVQEAQKMLIEDVTTTNSSTDDTRTKQRPITRGRDTDEKTIAWILYSICSSHEFDEVPVRHNEEFLNEELSATLMWGPDTAGLVSGNSNQYHEIEIFESPHTKCFLMIQAYLEHAKLPISDYVNDTKSVVENLPRLLSAFAFIAAGEQDSPGSFEVLTQCSRTRQLLEARASVRDNALLQLPGVDETAAEKLLEAGCTMFELRQMKVEIATSELRKCLSSRKRKMAESATDALMSFPSLRILTAVVSMESESVGRVELVVDVSFESSKRNSRRREKSFSGLSLTILLGTQKQRLLLTRESVSLSRRGKLSRILSFDYSKAKLEGTLILRLLVEEVRGLDSEMVLKLPS